MASEKNLNAVFTDIANAIRGKKGTTDQIKPINMADEIANLPSGGGETVELSVTQNGTYVPDEGTTYSKVSVNVPQSVASGTVKTLFDATKKCSNLFSGYKGTSIDGLISYSDTSNVTDMNHMFYSCSSLTTIPLFDTSSVTNMSDMFSGCKALTTIPQLDTSSVTSMSYMFNYCSKLTTVPQLDTSKVTNMSSMFKSCSSLTTIPLLVTSSVTYMSSMFEGCSKINALPLFDTSNVTNMQCMFQYCNELNSIPQLNTSKVNFMKYMFQACYKLTTIPQLDTSNVTNMDSMFWGCSSLATIPQLDVSKVTSMSNMFKNCTSLKSILMTGMKVSFNISDSTLFEESDLVTIINNLATVASTQTLTMGSTNLAKLTDEEKAIATNKGWTLA